jgi:hypothetical protein
MEQRPNVNTIARTLWDLFNYICITHNEQKLSFDKTCKRNERIFLYMKHPKVTSNTTL